MVAMRMDPGMKIMISLVVTRLRTTGQVTVNVLMVQRKWRKGVLNGLTAHAKKLAKVMFHAVRFISNHYRTLVIIFYIGFPLPDMY